MRNIKKAIIFSIGLVFLSLVSAGQHSLREFVWNDLQELYLNETIKTKVLTFEGSVTDEKTGLLPVYIERIPLKSQQVRLNAYIINPVFDTIPSSIISFLDDQDLIHEVLQIYTEIIFIDKKPYAEILFVPLQHNSISNSYEKLLSCELRYKIVPDESLGNRSDTQDFRWNSILSTGEWYRIATQETGIHIITYNDFISMGIDINNVDPRNIRLYCNGNGMLPESNAVERTDDLSENAITIVGENDGKFDSQDYVLFYGQGPTVWRFNNFSGLFEHQVNFYADYVYYFINTDLGPGKRINNDSTVTQEPTHIVSTFTDYAYHEIDNINILKTGKMWFGEEFKDQITFDYIFSFPNLDLSIPVSLRTNLAARSTQNSSFDFTVNNELILTANINSVNIGSTIYAWSITPDTVGFSPGIDNFSVNVKYNGTSNIAEGWMNYIQLNARRHLIMESGQLAFRDHRSMGNGNISEFHLSNSPANITIWDVTVRDEVKKINGSHLNNDYIFKITTNKLREFIAFDGSNFLPVTYIDNLDNQNLHSYSPVDFIIISHPDFIDQAERIGNIHQQVDGFSYIVVTPQQIYNEFSSGAQDISAIRDFCKMLYHRADSTNLPRYLLLFGDGSYDPKCRDIKNSNFIPTFQSMESLKHGYSFITEDFYGLYDDTEGNNAYGKTIDIGIGRFPVQTHEQAKSMVDKIEHYLSKTHKVMGDWRNMVCFIADDEDNNIHLRQAERLQAIVDTTYEDFNTDKIYLDAYTQVSTPKGDRYPDVNKAFTEVVEKGALIINYTGHGGETGLAHERILDNSMINSWRNIDNMPLFITATCEFSRFDEPGIVSAGEWVILNPEGASISLFTTTRLAWSDPNFKLNKIIYEYAFEKVDGEYPRLGDLVKISKTIMNTSQNIKNFVLLGDPALKLAYPKYNISTTSINSNDVSSTTDTIQSLEKVTVTGFIADDDGNMITDFNGYLLPTVFDKESRYYTIENDPSSQVASFYLRDKVLSQCKASVINGEFSFTFNMPKDIIPKYGEGKISFYAYDTINFLDAHGREEVIVGGTDPNAILDYIGPDILVYLDNINFVSGDFVEDSPTLMVYLYDEQGINYFANGIGHDVTACLDDDYRQTIELNTYFTPLLDNYKCGWIYYPFTNLSEGMHTLEIKAWDIHNNPSGKKITFFVNSMGALEVDQVINVPNPFSDRTKFVFNHNKPGVTFDVEINIFNITGQMIKTIKSRVLAIGQNIETIDWDGRDDSGSRLSLGIYPYRIKIWDDQGHYKEYSQKLVIGR